MLGAGTGSSSTLDLHVTREVAAKSSDILVVDVLNTFTTEVAGFSYRGAGSPATRSCVSWFRHNFLEWDIFNIYFIFEGVLSCDGFLWGKLRSGGVRTKVL